MKRNLLFGFALVAAMSAQAVSSPYAGSPAAEGTYYLYQVESGQWLQTNRSNIEQWTTYGTLDNVGFDVELIKPEGFEGFQIFCRMTNNGSLNGADQDRFFLDQPDRDITDWIFEPVTVDGVTNAYKIMAKATPEGTGERSAIANDFYIGATDGVLSDNPTDMTWQLVSRDERLRKMQADVANGPVDASWLIPWNDRGRNDMRDRVWKVDVTNNQGGGLGFDGSRGYPVQEYWHQIITRHSLTLTDLPAGTYEFSVQAYYRDTEIESNELAQRNLDGEENLRATYFAGAKSAPVMSIFQDAKSEQTDGFNYFVELNGKWVPNNMSDASRAMFDGNYINEYIKAPVSDGTLTIGIDKPTAEFRDWLIVKRLYLRYVSAEVEGEDLSGLQQQLTDLIAEAEKLPQTPGFVPAVEAAKESLSTAKSASALLQAIADLQGAVNTIKSSLDFINAFNATKVITDGMGVDTTEADERFANATSKGNYEDALKSLRYARRLHVADRQADVFEGHKPEVGRFYLYNIGRGQFLCGGSDWGAHAALNLAGVEIALEEAGEGKDGLVKFYIETGLYNGEKHHLNYRGYMDGPMIDGFSFIPVEGKENVYNIVQGDYPDVHMGWNPYAGTDQNNNDETTVGTECRNLQADDLGAQWKLVTLDDRKALLEKASLQNPVDATFMIKSPGFNQREDATGVWETGGNFGIWDYGANHNDFVAESWNTSSADLNQMIEGLPSGVYKAGVQGYYRNGDIENQVNAEPLQLAYFYAGNDSNDDVALPNILTESFNAPGEGRKISGEDGTAYEVPDGCVEAANYFKSGLYKTYTVIEKANEDDMPLGITKESAAAERDWIVVDNFRLTYYGKDTNKNEVIEAITSGVSNIAIDNFARPEDNRIFNLQGIEVSNPNVPGIYIRNGKKFIVR